MGLDTACRCGIRRRAKAVESVSSSLYEYFVREPEAWRKSSAGLAPCLVNWMSWWSSAGPGSICGFGFRMDSPPTGSMEDVEIVPCSSSIAGNAGIWRGKMAT